MTHTTALRWDLPLLLVSAAGLVVAAVALWQYVALRARVARPMALLLAALRSAAVALVLLALLGPALVRRSFSAERLPIAVALDVSRSMGLKGGLAASRLDRVPAALRSAPHARLADRYLPEYLAFSDTVVRVQPAGLDALRPGGARTDLEAPLREAPGRDARPPAAILLLTDGGHGAAPGAAAPGEVPVVAIGVGAGEKPRDVEIAGVVAPAIAFAGQPLQLQVTIRSSGFAGRRLPLLLKRGSQVLVSRDVEMPRDGEPLVVAVDWTPPAPGAHALTLELPVVEGEEVAENNRADLTVEASRDKIRVLLVTGSPTWNYRFLRGALKGDPTVDLVSFIILRGASDAVDVPQQELSLIPFPTQKIFLEELPNFDLLIFDNFAYQPYLPVPYLEKIADFVKGGGAFWMLGGPLSFAGGGYGSTPLAPLLPVELGRVSAPDGGFREGTFRGQLTAAGRNHPFFQGVGDPAAPLPPLEGLNLSGPAKAGSVVLAEVPRGGGGADPLVVVGRFGRGRTLAVLSDSLWRWAFEEIGRGRGNRAYLSFVRQALRWSVGDPQLQPVRVEADRRRVAPGEPLRARIHVLGDDFLPARNPQLSVTLRGPQGETRALAPVAEGPGVFRVEGEAGAEGTWEIVAEASARGGVYGRGTQTVAAAWPPEEFRSPGLNREALAGLIARRRGAFLELREPQETAAAIEKALAEIAAPESGTRQETRPLAEEPFVFLAFLGILGAEWFTRRRSGLD